MNEIEVLKQDEVVKFKGEGTAIEQQANALMVVDEASRAEASEMREVARQFKKAVQDRFKEPKEAADKAHRAIVALEKEMYAPADRVMTVLNAKSNDYLMEQERIRKKAEAKARKEAEAEAERERQRLLKAAIKAEERGDSDKADQKLQEAEQVQAATPIFSGPDKTVRTDSGSTSARKDFDIVVVDPMAVFRAVVSGEIPPAVLEIKPGPLKRHAEMKRIGDQLPVIPGCNLSPKFTFSGRGGR